MSIFKCKMCGGSLEVEKGQTICECEYCGTKQTVSATDDEVVTNLYNRANNLRIKCEFDKAQEIYEKIVAKKPNEAEAYWGIVLCKYGIEYVEDPNTYKRVPTCHRTQLESVLTDVDYLSAIENADSNQRLIYEQEAKEIDKLQKDILSIVHNEKPFDVFICYKETDENGKRTVESVLANDIYYQLTQEGLKVFYAAITLENKLGQEYEPYIFSALNSAKVMLVVGTKPENFNAVWVKNEWSRYLKLMSNDRSKTLIPCFRDMDAYDLPDEFSHLQAQDMSKIGFINDSDSVAKVKKSIEEYNKIANYKDVDNRILLSEEKIKQLNSIANEKQIAYSKKRKRKFTIVLSIITVIIVGIILAFVITNVNKSNNYNSAVQMLESGQYQEAYDLFRELGDYKDSEKQMDNAKIEAQISNLKNINVGDVIKFGIIGDEDIEWQVLDKKDNEIFVITKYIYSCDTYDGCDWESSFIRKKLNTDVGYSDDGFYYYFYFNEDAKTMIQTTNVIYKDENGTEKNTADKLFLLSVDEYNKYFKNPSEAKCTPSKNNPSKNGILDHWDCWMLRSPTSGLSREVECVSGSGEVLNSSDIYDEYYVGVRPAMWINLEK